MTRVRLVLMLVVIALMIGAVVVTIIQETSPCRRGVPYEEGGCPDL